MKFWQPEFPASDPPSWTPRDRASGPKRWCRASHRGVSDPVWWTSSERWIRCPQWQTHEAGEPRRRFTDEFKQQAVRLVLDEGKSVSGGGPRARSGPRSALGQWVKQRAGGSLEGAHRADDRGARGAGAAPQRESDPPGRARHPKKSHGVLREAEPMRFAFIAAKKAEHRVTILCRCMRVTRSGFYAWLRRGLSARAQRDLVLRTKLRAFHAASGQRLRSSALVEGPARRTARPSAKSASGA